jgi:glycosyltransferase involved in cell wall biosynthesis
VIVVPLGETSRAEIEQRVREHFDGVDIEWLDRGKLRRRPWLEVPRLLTRRYTQAALVAPDLNQPRVALTSLVLSVVRAREYWRLDLHGRREAFSPGAHLRRMWWPMLRHVLGCGLALLLAYPVLVALRALLRPRTMRPREPRQVLYLRSQFWLGLQGGGSVAHTAGVIDGLRQLGVEVAVVSSDRLAGVAEPVTVLAPTTWFDGLLREAEELAYNVGFLRVTWQRARQLRPEAIYQRHTAFNVVGAVLSRLLRVPLVLEFNSSEVWKGRHWGGLHLPRIAALVEEINLRAADRIVVVSRPLRDSLVAEGVPSDKVLVNPNGVDVARFEPKQGGDGLRTRLGLSGGVVVCFSGTFGVWHGIPTLASAIPRVLALRPGARWLLVGDGPLRQLVEPLVAPGRVVLTGLVPHSAMPERLAAADILVSPHGKQADGGEFFGSPTKLFEYMAAGRPIVASAVGQIAEVLADGETALLVPPDDPEALARAIVRLIDDAALRQRLAVAARHAAEERHTWRHNAERLLGSMRSP